MDFALIISEAAKTYQFSRVSSLQHILCWREALDVILMPGYMIRIVLLMIDPVMFVYRFGSQVDSQLFEYLDVHI